MLFTADDRWLETLIVILDVPIQVNVDPTEALIQQLRAENERLRAQAGDGRGGLSGDNLLMSVEEREVIRRELEEGMQVRFLLS